MLLDKHILLAYDVLRVVSYELLEDVIWLAWIVLSVGAGVQLSVGRRVVRVRDEDLRQETATAVPRALGIWQR